MAKNCLEVFEVSDREKKVRRIDVARTTLSAMCINPNAVIKLNTVIPDENYVPLRHEKRRLHGLACINKLLRECLLMYFMQRWPFFAFLSCKKVFLYPMLGKPDRVECYWND